jgi:uncharacterized YccA/Bax inhibitor family protein
MVQTYQATPSAPADHFHHQPDGTWLFWNGSAWTSLPPGITPPQAQSTPFTAAGAFNKAGLLGLLALAVGTAAYLSDPPLAVAWVGMFIAFAVGMWCSFAPRRAAALSPVFASVEGLVLGALSRYYADAGQHVVTLAIVGTLAIVVGVWALYRTGLVRIGHKFLQVTMVVTLGMVATMVVSILTGWGTSGISGLIIFGVLYLIIAVMNLFVDFAFAYHAQSANLDAQAEWYSAFSLLLSSMMVYLALLRIFGGRS